MVLERNQTLEILIMNKTINEIYGIDTKKLIDWFKKHIAIIAVTFLVAFAFGYTRAEASFEMDCKYAKAVRLGTSAFRCERIL